MPSLYVQAAEYGLYGLPLATTVEQVIEASTIIDAWLSRPEGLVAGTDIVEQTRVTRWGWVLVRRTPIYAVTALDYRTHPQADWKPVSPEAVASGNPGQGMLTAPTTVPHRAFVRVTYQAGFDRAALPTQVKMATAALVNNMRNMEDVPIAASKAQAGDAELQLFVASRLDEDIKLMVAPWKRVV
jgi:hypothetical protein